MATEILPFLFRHVEALDRYLVTNQAGAFEFLDNRAQLESLARGCLLEIPEEKQENLYAKNFATQDGDLTERAVLLGSRFATRLREALISPTLFMVVPTLRCDHDCIYCQASRAPINRSSYDLSEGRTARLLSLISAVAGPSPKIEFQGGEPLLAFAVVRRLVEQARHTLAALSPSFVICSALGPLNEEMVEWARSQPVSFSVSLDGPEEVHDTNRPSPYFTPYRRVVDNIARLKGVLGPDRVSCLATITRQSLNHPEAIVDTYFTLGQPAIFLRPLSPFGFAAHKLRQLGYSAAEYFGFFQAALDRVLELNDERVFIEEAALIRLRRIFRPAEVGYLDLKSPAGHVLGSLVINYDGRIFGSDEARMLWEMTRADALVIGTLDDEPERLFHHEPSISLLTDTFTCATPGCDECAYQPYCGADPLHHLATQGDHVGNKALSFFCQLERLTFDHLLTLYKSSPHARSVFDQWLQC